MIAKTGTGKSFKGLASYLQDEIKKGTILDSDGVRTTTPQAMAYDFHQQAKHNQRTVKSVGHDSLSFSLQDKKMSDQEMKEIAKDYMNKMGYTDTQFVIIRHNDRSHEHCHIVYNRVDNNGKTITDKLNYYRANEVCRELEKKYDLTLVDGKLKSKEEVRNRDKKGLENKIERYSNPQVLNPQGEIKEFEFEKDDSLEHKKEYLKAMTAEERQKVIHEVEQSREDKKEQENSNNLKL